MGHNGSGFCQLGLGISHGRLMNNHDFSLVLTGDRKMVKWSPWNQRAHLNLRLVLPLAHIAWLSQLQCVRISVCVLGWSWSDSRVHCVAFVRVMGRSAHYVETAEPAGPPLAVAAEHFHERTGHCKAFVVYSPRLREGCLVIYTAVTCLQNQLATGLQPVTENTALTEGHTLDSSFNNRADARIGGALLSGKATFTYCDKK